MCAGPANADNPQLLPASSSAADAATAAKYLPIHLDLRGSAMSLPTYGTGVNTGGVAAAAASPALPQYAFTAEDVARHQQQHNLFATTGQPQQPAAQTNGHEQQRTSSHGRTGPAGQGGVNDGGLNLNEGGQNANAASVPSASAAGGTYAFASAPQASGSNEANIVVADAVPKVESGNAGTAATSSSADDAKVEGYSPDDPYIPALGRGARRSSGTGRPRVSYKEHLDTSSGDSDNSADSDFADEDDIGAGGSSKSRRTSTGGGGRGRGRPRKSSNAGALGFAAPKPAVANGMTLTGLPPPFIPGSHAAGGVLLEAGEDEQMYDPALLGEASTSNGAGGHGGRNKSSSKNRKRTSPDSTPGAIDPVTGFPRRTTEIPAVEDDPTIRPYGCNWCFTERREIERFARRQRRAMGLMDPKGKGRAMDQLPSLTGPSAIGLDALPILTGAGFGGGGVEQNGAGQPDQDDYDSEEERQLSAAAIDPNLPPIQWRTVKELREHMSKEHKDRPLKAKKDDKEDGGLGYLGDGSGLLPSLNGGGGEADLPTPGAGTASTPDDRILSPADMPFRCALVPCDKTFKSLAGLRFHFQNASTNGHFVVQVDLDPETGEERATKRFKVDAKPSGRELKCPIPRCPKRFKQAAGASLPFGLILTVASPP